jgi:hypothetical protein
MKFQSILLLPIFGQAASVITRNGPIQCPDTPVACSKEVKCPSGTSCKVRSTRYTCPTLVCEPSIAPVPCPRILVRCHEQSCEKGFYCREIYETFACPKIACIKNSF